MADLPLIVEPDALQDHLEDSDVRVVDLSRPETYAKLHVPGAVHLDYGRLTREAPPAKGLLPDPADLSRVLGELGLSAETRVIAYDDEGGGRAGRLLWTLDCVGHARASLLNGGLHAWANEGYPLSQSPSTVDAATYHAEPCEDEPLADAEYIYERLGDPSLALLDTRSAGEYQGTDVRAQRGGHIPGAVHFEWTEAMDRERNLRLKPADALRRQFESLGVTPDKEIVAYCQTHHRSAHTYVVLKALGYRQVKGYAGAWSEWGNNASLPVE